MSGEGGVVLKIVADDGAAVRRFHLAAGDHLVGADPEAAVHLPEAGVSRRHARLEVLPDGGVVVEDLGSKNGTRVHGRRVRRAAVAGTAVLAFGPVQGLLGPAAPQRHELLLRPGEADAGEEATGRAATAHPTTLDLGAASRVARALSDALSPLLAGDVTVARAADELAQNLLAALPVGRVEVVRRPADAGEEADAGGAAEAVVAAATTHRRLPQDRERLDVAGADGWELRLRAPDSGPLAPLEPLLAAAVSLLAAGARRPAGGGRRPPAPAAAGVVGAEPPAGLGPAMSRLYRRAGRIARGEVSVLVLGESGVGKEVLSRWIHARSQRADGPFLAVNCAALPRELLEAELFGIERGVATGVDARPGILERASGGTVLLDEIGDMPPELQAKVLRVLESTSLYRVGGRTPVTVDVRFIAATNRELAERLDGGGFRRDLYHRLAAFEAHIPPLRQRREEIPSLASRFFDDELRRAGGDSPGITRGALAALVGYRWPGNVRELRNEIATAVLLLAPGEPLAASHLSARLRRTAGDDGEPDAGDELALAAAVRRAERQAFGVALAAAAGEAVRAMELLGISRTTYYRKLKELRLDG